MKRILLPLAVLALLVPVGPQAEARTDISIDFFYDNLNDGGSWVDVADYGYCWQPTVAVSNRTWRPYSDGYWAYTDVGWTWVSYEDFGWATYHYGRWIRLRGRGWVWVPGRDWGPAWVSWRTGGDFVGWAPLPPKRPGEYWDESPITARVDIDFDIGPAYYNFIDVRYIGEPVLRERIFAAEQNVTYIAKTVNVTNITYTNSTVYNYGPDYDIVSRYSTRPIQRLSLQRETSVDPVAAAQSKSLMKVQGDKLVVAAPQQFQKPAKAVAPKVVKEKVTQASVEHGWEPVSDKKAQADLKAKMQKEDPKNVPPPTIQASEKKEPKPASTAPATTTSSATTTPGTNASLTTSPPASPMTSAPPAPAASASASGPKDKRKDKNQRPANLSPAPSASPSVTARTTPAGTPEKNKNQREEKAVPSAAPSISAPRSEKWENKQNDNAPKALKEKSEKRKNELDTAAPPMPMQNNAPRSTPPPVTRPELMKDSKRELPTDSARKMKKELPQERVVAPPTSNVPANPPGKDEGKKQKNEPATSPSP